VRAVLVRDAGSGGGGDIGGVRRHQHV
jgi:hypothetical protein